MYLLKSIAFIATICLITGCQAVLIEKPGNSELHEARAFISSKNNKQAVVLLNKALESEWEIIRAKAYYELALIEKSKKNYKNYKNLLEKASYLNNNQATINLAYAYLNHDPTKQNIKKAKSILINHIGNSPKANIELARISNSITRQKEYIQQAKELYQNEILKEGQNNGKTYLKLARMYNKYKELPIDMKEAEFWYRKAVAEGNDTAAYELAKLWIKFNLRKNPEKDAFKLIQQVANIGNEEAIKYIASAYLHGRGVERNLSEAIKLYDTIPNFGQKESFETIADAYMQGKEVNKSLDNAFYWYKKAALKGSTKSIIMMASKTKNSLPDWEKKLKLISPDKIYASVKKSNRLYGKEYPQIISRQYYIAAINGSSEAALTTANNFESGFSVKQNRKKSREWYEKAANLGSNQAMIIMARLYSLDINDNNAIKKSFYWYKRAAEMGMVEAQYQTGLSYARGNGIAKNIKQAHYWLQKAHNNGYSLALETLETIQQ